MKRAREQQSPGMMQAKTAKYADNASYAEAIKAGQRSSQNFKHAWHTYCDQAGHMTYDPTKHNVDFVQSFFDQLGVMYLQMTGNGGYVQPGRAMRQPAPPQYGAGQGGYGNGAAGGYQQQQPYEPRGGKGGSGGGSVPRANREAHPALPKVIELVKQGQRNSQEWKTLWIDWCQKNGNGIQDPNRHSAMFIIAFVLKYGLAEVVSSNWAGPYLVSLGELSKPYMVNTIKKGQSIDEVWKESWGQFADSKSTLNNELSEMARINVRNGFERSSRCVIWSDGSCLGVVDFHMRSSK
jgi:hypothetical protein